MIDFLLGTQWGDEGKGRIIDLISLNYDYVVRCAGGDNAGHSVLVNGKLLKLHLIPSCVLHENVNMVLGAGMVINPVTFKKEVTSLRELGININQCNLSVSELAHVITSEHIQRDVASEDILGVNKIGTTKRGIGPAYVDKYNRVGIRLKDVGLLDMEGIDFLMQFVKDTRELLYSANKFNKKILCEGAQGTLLDITWGTYPYVTSSDTTIYGCLAGMGIGVRNIGKIIGVVKAFQTRIGTGPFPTEIKDESLVLRLRGTGENSWDEFGATTGRPRRIGWLDIPYLKYAIELNGINELALTKLDILTGLDKIKICVNHNPEEYEEFDRWYSLGNSWDGFAGNARKYVERIELLTNTPIKIISTGAERDSVVYKY